MNIYAGRQFGWDWQDHIDNGRLGGDDMKAAVGELILAPVAGTVARTAHSFTITEPDGWKTVCLELAVTKARTTVGVGDVIGAAGSMWPHWHSLNPAGVRVPARFLHETPDPSAPPVPTIRIDMRIIYNLDSTDDATRRAIVGETSFQVITAAQSTREVKLWGAPVNFTVGEWDACRDLVYARRAALGLPGGSGGWVPTDADIVDEGEYGQGQTSTVILVNQHADTNKNEILTALGNLTLTAAP